MTINTNVTATAAAILATLALACGRTDRPSAEAGEERAAGTSPVIREAEGGAANGEGLVSGTPAGGLGQWIAEVRAGLDTLPELAARDAAAARNEALLLYVNRQEYIEIYFGTTGRAVKDARLAEAVVTAEARFHELLTTVNALDRAIDVGALRAAASRLSEEYDRVLGRAAELRLDLDALALEPGGGA